MDRNSHFQHRGRAPDKSNAKRSFRTWSVLPRCLPTHAWRRCGALAPFALAAEQLPLVPLLSPVVEGPAYCCHPGVPAQADDITTLAAIPQSVKSSASPTYRMKCGRRHTDHDLYRDHRRLHHQRTGIRSSHRPELLACPPSRAPSMNHDQRFSPTICRSPGGIPARHSPLSRKLAERRN